MMAQTDAFTYDADNRLSSVSRGGTTLAAYGYDKVGNRQSLARGNGVNTTYRYDILNRLTDVLNSAGGSFHYLLNPDGKRASVTVSGAAVGSGTTVYTYDNDGRLTQESGPQGTVQYVYETDGAGRFDSVGNRLQKVVSGAASGNGTTVYVYDNNDRITGESGPGGTVVHTYDLDGRETTVAGQAATYDFEDHLVSVGSTTGYAYDADGGRVQAVTAAGTTNSLVDASLPFASVAEERSTSGALVARYDYGDDLIRMDRGGAASYYVFDGLGSTRALTSAAGVATNGYAYDAFGSLTASTGSTINPFLFDGQQFDGGTGLYYLRARYYAPTAGRFLSQDPFVGDREDPISLHRYLYASDDPANNTDAGGMDDLGEVNLSQAIGQYLNSLSTSVFVRASLFAARNPALIRLALYGQGALVLYNYISDPDTAQLAAATGGFSSDIQLIDDIASDTSRAFAIFKDLDELGRPTGMIARLNETSIDTGSDASSRIIPPGFRTLPASNRARGHLLAKILGGPGNIKENLVALYQTRANSPEMRDLEVSIRNLIRDEHMTVYYRVTPIYAGDEAIARSVRIEASGANADGKTFTLDQTIMNEGSL